MKEKQILRGEMSLKRFCVFEGYQYYPQGGFNDFKESYKTLEEAQNHKVTGDWWHIFDIKKGIIVFEATNEND